MIQIDPERISKEQIEELKGLLGDALHTPGNPLSVAFHAGTIEAVLAEEEKGLKEDFWKVLFERTKKWRKILWVGDVNRSLTPEEAFGQIEHETRCTEEGVVANIPSRGSGMSRDVQVEFFTLGRMASCEEVEAEFVKRGLERDPYAVMAVNAADPAFADEYPNSTLWKNEDGTWSSLSFDQSNQHGEKRYVEVDCSSLNNWAKDMWFGGTRKYSGYS